MWGIDECRAFEHEREIERALTSGKRELGLHGKSEENRVLERKTVEKCFRWKKVIASL